MKELKLEELSVKQKLGIVTVALVSDNEEQLDYIVELVKEKAVGAVWVRPGRVLSEIAIKRIKEAADYPVLIMTDAESGIGEYLVGRHNSVAMTGSEELAYTFGKVTAVTARQMGYNVVCNPILDLVSGNALCGANSRSLGSDKYKVTALASAIARGMHDGGVLTVGKHYPGGGKSKGKALIDSHMAETSSDTTREELLEYNLYPYLELNKQGLLDGIMTTHGRFHNIDPVYPATLSKALIDIIRNEGFEGFAITDAMTMMGVVSRFGAVHSLGLSVENGNDLSLAFRADHRFAYEAMCKCYDDGIIHDDRLDEAVRRVLEAQHKTLREPKCTSLAETDIKTFNRINTDCICVRTDEGVAPTLSREGRHYFAILTNKEVDMSKRNQLDLDTFTYEWHNPVAIADKIAELFPNSGVGTVSQFPMPHENMNILHGQLEYDDVVFVTFFEGRPAIGRECFTSRILALADALQVDGRISTVVHFGNPFVLEDLPHVERTVIAPGSFASSISAFDVLAGEYPALGTLTYDVNFK